METATIPDWPLSYRVRRAIEVGDVEMEDVAAALGVTKNTIYNYIAGNRRPRRAALTVIASMTGVPLWWLEGAEDGDSDTGAVTLKELPAQLSLFELETIEVDDLDSDDDELTIVAELTAA